MFWSRERQLQFLTDVSDRVEPQKKKNDKKEASFSPEKGEKEKRNWAAAAAAVDHDGIRRLERNRVAIIGDNWGAKLPETLHQDLGTYRKYDLHSVCDLLRMLRNKKHHYRDLSAELRAEIGEIPNGYLTYFTMRFPKVCPLS